MGAPQTTLLRLATAGSVDDGKSTLVGRLLHDTKNVLVDQLEAVEHVSRDRGLTAADLALLTDGLRAEREQGITIDVAYRYFATAERTFILADCPGHVQYTRNTVTGASTADVIVLVLDARKGVLEQTRRHLAVAALLRVRHVVVAVNKIDLTAYSEEIFHRVSGEIRRVAAQMGVPEISTIPVSALVGDNVAHRSANTEWYGGPSLLELLTTLPPQAEVDAAFRFPVQCVLRPQTAAVDPRYVEYRGYAGQIAAGAVRVGDDVVALPGGVHTIVAGIDTADGELTHARAPQSVSIRLADDIDLTRGDVIAAAQDAPTPTRDLDAMVCWLGDRPLRVGAKVLVKHATTVTQGIVRDLHGRLDLDTLAPQDADQLKLNDIGRVAVRLAAPVMAQRYADSRAMGAFLMIDPQAGHTLAAGLIRGDEAFSDDAAVQPAHILNWEI